MNILEINVNGPQMITQAFMPLMRKGDRKLVVNTYVCPIEGTALTARAQESRHGG